MNERRLPEQMSDDWLPMKSGEAFIALAESVGIEWKLGSRQQVTSDVSRRGFLKACAAITAGALVLPSLRLILPNESLLAGEQWIATVRELCGYDIYSDEIVLRHDILGPTDQYYCAQRIPPNQRELVTARKIAATLLEDKMRAEGLTIHDLKPLPIPPGFDTYHLDRLPA